MTTRPSILIARNIFPEVVARLREHFDVDTNDGDAVLSAQELKDRLQGKAGVLTTGSEKVDAALIAACPQLKVVANIAVGYNNFDVPAMTAAGVVATNTPDVLTETTADFGFALLMATARRLTESEHFLRAGLWNQWRLDMFAGAEVHGSTLGILGMGRIGQAIARRGAHGFGMNVIYHNRSRLDAATEAECKARYVSKEDLLRQADHLVLVLPYSAESHHAIGAAELARMKPTATLINIARGGHHQREAEVGRGLGQHVGRVGGQHTGRRHRRHIEVVVAHRDVGGDAQPRTRRQQRRVDAFAARGHHPRLALQALRQLGGAEHGVGVIVVDLKMRPQALHHLGKHGARDQDGGARGHEGLP